MTVVTRFAPSPTGFLHIGGARTALFNYLFARHHQGKYRLRIEDTDRARSTPEAVAAIFDGLEWLGLGGDGEVVYQSERIDRHIEVAQQLLQQGHAYRCYLTAEELKDLREGAYKSGTQMVSPWRDAPLSSAPDKPFTVRLRMPLDGTTTIRDSVQGTVTIAHKTLDDLVMLRSDGTPTYMLAVVVDDFDMGVSHVIRGDDHLNNAFRQQKIIEALGWPVPVYAHIPLIHGTDSTKMSKRDGAVAVGDYKKHGFLAEALGNYLLRLGWSHGDDEIISREQAIEWFSLEAIGKAPARFDKKKLASLNSQYIRALPSEKLVAIMLGEGQAAPEHIISRLHKLAPAFAERATSLDDLIGLDFITSDNAPDLSHEAKNLLDETALGRLDRLAHDLPDALDTPDAFKDWLRGWLQTQDLAMRDIGPALRAALTGRTQTPDITLIAAALGQAQIIKRIKALYK